MLFRFIPSLSIALLMAFLPSCPVMAMQDTHWPQAGESDKPSLKKPAVIVYFTTPIPGEQQHSASIHRMARQAKSDFGLTVTEVALKDESELAASIERIAENDTGLIIIVAPHRLDVLMSLPGLYPDVPFSIIDVPSPIYLANVHTMRFKETDGAFMMGTLAALTSRRGAVKCVGASSGEHAQELAGSFINGAKYAKTGIIVSRELGSSRNPQDDSADVLFLLDEETLPTALRKARQQKRLLMLFDHDLTGEYPGTVLTSLIKHYDLAIYSTLKNYRHDKWKPGDQQVGVGEGYVDYVLNDYNKSLLTKDVIDKVERARDLLAQGVVSASPPPPR